jgi:hypothetical protein
MDMRDLVLERKGQKDTSPVLNLGPSVVGVLTPSIDAGYWAYRVRLSNTQAILGFPKFSTIGIGFAEEEDWNTNLPYTCTAEMIYNHIDHNKGDDAISAEDCIRAIKMIQDAVREDRA